MKKIDTVILSTAIILSFIGLLMIFSTGGTNYLVKQSIWLAAAVVLAILISQVSTRAWAILSPYLYIAVVILLLLLFVIPGSYPKRWFKYGDISFQPSEFAKLGVIVFLANHLVRKKKLDKFVDMIIPLAIVTVPALLVFVEPDFGAAQIFFPILIAMLFWAGMPASKTFIFFSPIISAIASFSIYIWIGYMGILAVFLYFRKKLSDLLYGLIANPLAGLMTPIIWDSLKTYQQKRIISFFSPWLDPKGMSWQIIQSKIAIGSGKLFGKGFLSGTQKKLEFLPERHTDFIFSCIGEEFGLIGILITIGIYVFFFYKLLDLARATKNRYSSIMVIGILAWFSYQTFINTGMTLGLLPITGVPLPFISYGGSALIAGFIAVGIALYISKTKYEY